VQSAKNWHIFNSSDLTARICWTFYTNLLELCRTYTERTIGTLVYLKTAASWPGSLHSLWNLNVQCTLFSLDVTCICELQENIHGHNFKYKWKLNINCSILKYNMWTPTHNKLVKQWALHCLLCKIIWAKSDVICHIRTYTNKPPGKQNTSRGHSVLICRILI